MSSKNPLLSPLAALGITCMYHYTWILIYFLYFILCGWFLSSVYVCAPCTSSAHKEPEVGVRLSELGLCKVASRDIWILGVGPGSSGRTTSAINWWTISSVSGPAHLAFLFFYYYFSLMWVLIIRLRSLCLLDKPLPDEISLQLSCFLILKPIYIVEI